MITLLIGGALALLITIVGMKFFIAFLVKKSYGQFVRDDGPQEHHTKRGTPTMGGALIVGSVVVSYFLSHALVGAIRGTGFHPTASGMLLLFLMAGMGFVGFIDDAKKITNQRSLGLSPMGKILLQTGIGVVFAVLALQFPNERGLTPASFLISFQRDIPVLNLAFAGTVLGTILFVIWSNLIVTAASNGVNLTDGLDGLAGGAAIMVFTAYLLIGIWQSNQACGGGREIAAACYTTRDPMDLAAIAAMLCGSLVGFLWWNASPAKIFMGDTGSLALGGAVAGFAILSRTELLLPIIAGLFVLITLSVILQVGYFKLSGGKRIFKMAPLQHHFELLGWAEVTVVIRFWILAGLFVAVGLGIFYFDWVVKLS
ncbi:phospho-N-acetylmuramoyl-pentapeptide-transferase [Falsarthrobacter nasiphocae]|uniref:Phospho-N-acetylmuramoyl-pentapeptide-transferase n=1 Tax=Falsarthrobacter nasiphocae TaxID=189863 RepID=A0AAE4C4G1_9MICC|nr:phospho-N-acetylmuramoyl-pentapeptide-transferase [Falsarthrobacter nasiphocae]MDR6891321.1 phospho-N-acetylmuramoyl-pentapeptide-transferase [Falsarthrobacter nasiphocae]